MHKFSFSIFNPSVLRSWDSEVILNQRFLYSIIIEVLCNSVYSVIILSSRKNAVLNQYMIKYGALTGWGQTKSAENLRVSPFNNEL
jgi:hypothetical protein